MNPQLKPCTNGDTAQPKWVQDDADDKLAERIASDPPPIPVDDDIEFLPAQNASGRSEIKPASQPQPKASQCVQRPARATETINAKELIHTIVNAYMDADSDNVSIFVDGSEIVIERKVNGFKNSWRIGLSHVRTASVKLIK